MSVTTLNPIEVRKAGIRALNEALGYDVAQAFLKQFTGTGDIVQTLRELPEPSLDELFDNVTRLDDDYAAGRIDAIGRPIAGV
jgi:hypothetical protein